MKPIYYSKLRGWGKLYLIVIASFIILPTINSQDCKFEDFDNTPLQELFFPIGNNNDRCSDECLNVCEYSNFIKIPVAFHVIPDPLEAFLWPEESLVESAIATANSILGPRIELVRADEYYPCVDFYNSPEEEFLTITVANELEIYNTSRYDPMKVLNVYVVRHLDSAPGPKGWARAPQFDSWSWAVDGITLSKDKWSGSAGTTLAHELGHWLSLLHIWGLNSHQDANCHAPASNCVAGDLVPDTAPCRGPWPWAPNPSGPNGDCTVNPDLWESIFEGSATNPFCGPEMINECKNLMNWGGNYRTEVSEGQFNRMIFAYHTLRPGVSPEYFSANIFNVGQTTASLNWNASTNSGGYEIKYRKVGEPDFIIVTITDESITEYQFQNLIRGTEYEVQISPLCNSEYIELFFETICSEESPDLSATTLSNECPFSYVDLNSLYLGDVPPEFTLVWSTDSDPSDGISEVVNSIVTSSGSYFAYFFHEEDNCYSLPSEEVVVTLISCCDIGQDEIIDTNTEFDLPMSFGGDLIVKSGATLTVNAATLYFAEEKNLIVENGGKLILKNNSFIYPCPNESSWNGIIVQTGGKVDASEAYIIHAKTGIAAEQNSMIKLDIVNIIGSNNQFGQGIHLANGVNAQKLNRLKIENYNVGIDAWGGNELYEVTNCEISNVFVAVRMVENTLILSGTTIASSKTGVYLWKSVGSIIDGNSIGYFNNGLRGYKSPFVSITNNTIGWPSQRGTLGINLSLSGGSAISNNPQIEATELGIKLWRSDVLIDHNEIEIFGQNNQFGGGIQINNSNGTQILENYLNVSQSAFGVESVASSGTRIENNQIDQFSFFIFPRTAAIRSMGSMDEEIGYNTVFGVVKTTGIIAQNTTSNDYSCNLTNNTKEGIGIYFNSEMQNLKGNELNANIDLSIRSEIGVQMHHGNQFIGGSARGFGLDDDQLAGSQFFVHSNDPNHSNLMPTDVIPSSDWFIDETNNNPFVCSGTQGPTWTPFNGGDPSEICSYFTYLKSINSEQPEQFLVKLIHLLKYAKKTYAFDLPSCITSDSTFLSLCGVTKLVDLGIELDSIGTASSDTTVTYLQGQYIIAPTANEKETIKLQLES